MKRQPTTSSLLRRLNRSAVVDVIRTEGVASPSSLAARLNISIPTVMRVIEDLIAEDLVAYDGFDEASARGRPRARIKFRGASHAIIGIEAGKGEFYGAVANLEGVVQTEMHETADDDGERNLQKITSLVERLMGAPRPAGQTIRGIGIGVPSIVKQPVGEVVLTLGLGWRDFPLRQLLSEKFDVPVFVENGRNLAAVGEWGFGAGRGADSVVSLSIGPGAGAGVVIDGKLYGGHSHAAGELGWYLDDPLLTGRPFEHLGDKQSLRFFGIPEQATKMLQEANTQYAAGKLTLAAVNDRQAGKIAPVVSELLDYATMAVGSVAAFMNPEIIVLAGRIVGGGDLVLDVLRHRLKGNVYDPPRLVIGALGHRDIVLGAVRLVLDATTLNPADSLVMPTKDQSIAIDSD
ncbi:ROK family transcriptional regulator [Devosia sp.]|uniref:ROK family transcriptional regulator n=1 Tax=Devosia sp. TaxID=1871048 RepID=UPI002FCB3BEB